MLHGRVRNSKRRVSLLRVVVMQRRLILSLCDLPPRTRPNQAWLERVWHNWPRSFVERFWTNDKGKRAKWIRKIAKAETAEKDSIRASFEAQLRFKELFDGGSSFSIPKWPNSSASEKAAKSLLNSFYNPLFYEANGFPERKAEVTFKRSDFIACFESERKICPYCDNAVQLTKLDHYLPKDSFPALSCHPDNLIPCCTDSNETKGTMLPLDPAERNQVEHWFHPRLRPTKDRFRIELIPAIGPSQEIRVSAIDASEQKAIDNFEKMFGLTKFWGAELAGEAGLLFSEIEDELKEYGEPKTEANLRTRIEKRQIRERLKTGKTALALVRAEFLGFVLSDKNLIAQQIP
ncbi:MAG: hypothetical protein JNJ70_24810 [Verrucomicrobiales bacterium]|nr:hypothetical protein [Verrucomicrobiales bacterium]